MTGYTYDYPRPMVTVDCIVTSELNKDLMVLLIRRAKEPFKGKWALPGGFVDLDEDLHIAARRELYEETGIECDDLKQFRAYGTPGRDPRGHTVSVVFTTQVTTSEIKAGDDAEHAEWHSISQLPELAFDHGQIISDYLQFLKG